MAQVNYILTGLRKALKPVCEDRSGKVIVIHVKRL